MDPEMGRLLAGRTAIESMPASDRRRPERSAGRTRSLTRVLMSAINDGLRMRSRATGPKATETATSPERHLSFETEGDRR
jgi:hypothetical protein